MKSKVLILNGPNLNALGRREPEKYGSRTLPELEEQWKAWGAERGMEVLCEQSNHEGVLLDRLHQCEEDGEVGAVVFNPGAFSHTSRALRDAIASMTIPVIEVHLSNIAAREEWRHVSFVSEVCAGSIVGFGALGYELALQAALTTMKGSR